MGNVIQDLRYTVRALARSPLFTVVTVLTLGLGIGANTSIFSVVNGVLLTPLPYGTPDRLVSIKSQFPTLGFEEFWISPPEYLELREWNRSFDAVGAYRTGAVSVNTDGPPMRVTSAVASASFFEALGVPAELGRTYSEEEDLPGAPGVITISHGLWRSAFASDPGVIGRTVLVNGSPVTVVGVMPDGFDIDDAGVDVWGPLGLDPASPGGRGSHYLYLVARTRAGLTLEQARQDVEGLLAGWRDRIPDSHVPNPETHRLLLTDLQDELVGGVRGQLWILLGAVGFVLLIACANVGNLLLARAESRQREVAVRVAMGARRGRLLRQFLTESAVLATLGGIAGLAIAWAALELMVGFSPGSIPRLETIGLDRQVLGFTALVTLVTGLLFGVAPGLHLSADTLSSALREGGTRSTRGAARGRVRRGLVVAEMALAVVLVVGSVLMLRSFSTLLDVDPGFDETGLLTWQMLLPPQTYPEAGQQNSFYGDLTRRLAALPGVESAAAMTGLPPRRDVDANDTEFEGIEETDDGPNHNVDYYQTVTASYFETMGIPILRGRGFEPRDMGADHGVAVINERLAQVFYPDVDPIGQRLRPCCGDPTPWFEIIGIARDVKQGGLEEETGTEIYISFEQLATLAPRFLPRNMNVVVRTAGDPGALAATARAAVWELDRALPLAGLQTMEQNISGSVARPRFLAMLLGAFAVLALSLAAVGTYGVMAYFVAERNREIGIRMAMGAASGDVLSMVLKSGGVLAAVGLVLGTAGAFFLSRLMESFVFGVSTNDPATFAVAPALLAAVAMLACYLPARRATRVDPVAVLKDE